MESEDDCDVVFTGGERWGFDDVAIGWSLFVVLEYSRVYSLSRTGLSRLVIKSPLAVTPLSAVLAIYVWIFHLGRAANPA